MARGVGLSSFSEQILSDLQNCKEGASAVEKLYALDGSARDATLGNVIQVSLAAELKARASRTSALQQRFLLESAIPCTLR